jgi:hypothetical protein
MDEKKKHTAPRVFVCCDERDIALVMPIVTMLDSEYIMWCRWRQEEASSGPAQAVESERAIINADAVLFCLSPNFVTNITCELQAGITFRHLNRIRYFVAIIAYTTIPRGVWASSMLYGSEVMSFQFYGDPSVQKRSQQGLMYMMHSSLPRITQSVREGVEALCALLNPIGLGMYEHEIRHNSVTRESFTPYFIKTDLPDIIKNEIHRLILLGKLGLLEK